MIPERWAIAPPRESGGLAVEPDSVVRIGRAALRLVDATVAVITIPGRRVGQSAGGFIAPGDVSSDDRASFGRGVGDRRVEEGGKAQGHRGRCPSDTPALIARRFPMLPKQ